MPAASSDTPGQPGLRPNRTQPYALARLAGLLDVSDAVGNLADIGLTGVAFDSRAVRSGDLYVALPGAKTHGARFVPSVLAAGAVAVLTDPAGAALLEAEGDLALPVLLLDDPRRAMATAAAEVYGRPATKLTMIGVTGTNGKTTTSYLLAAALAAAGRHSGVIGTLGYFLDDIEIAADRTTVTTPESPDLQALLAVLAERGADTVVMEVSSHALALGRADEIVFDVAAFTNFGRDHLDFHGTVEAYFEAKADLFTAARARRAVINIDDDRGPELVSRSLAAGLEVATTSLNGDERIGSGDHFRCVDYAADSDPVPVRIGTPQGDLDFRLGLTGSYNVANAITALAILDGIGVDLVGASTGLAEVSVPGRLQRVDLGAGAPRAYVDFAHTPQAVRSVLSELRNTLRQAQGPDSDKGPEPVEGPLSSKGPEPVEGPLTGRLICVVGCGGDRDPDKRGPMGEAAAELADVVIITDDNPRTEDPATIRAATLDGAHRRAAVGDREVSVVDGGVRSAAIRQALGLAGPADVIAVLGKGHERGQEIGGQILPFDDIDQLAAGWQELIQQPKAHR